MSDLGYAEWFPTHTPWGTRTYYDVPVSEHPATARARAHRDALLELPPSAETLEAVAYAERIIRGFEAGEYEARAQRLLRLLDLPIR